MKNYIQYKISIESPEESDRLVAILSGLGFDGFEEKEDSVEATAEEGAVQEEEINALLNELGCQYERIWVPGENWNAIWESNFTPIIIGKFAAIRAGFHSPVPDVLYDLEITPKMSFGTGHHPTTRLVVGLMQQIDFKEKRVIDFGTGTGVLAILAAKLGASRVEAIDNDEWSIVNTQENLIANNITGVSIIRANSVEGLGLADIVLANINKHIILSNLDCLSQILELDGFLILSGLLEGDESAIDDAIIGKGFLKVTTSKEGEWVALVYRKQLTGLHEGH